MEIKSPAFPLSSISLGPVSQFVEIIYFFKYCASKRILGRPSNFDVDMTISELSK